LIYRGQNGCGFSLPDGDISRNLCARGQKLASITVEQFERRLEQKNPALGFRPIAFPHPKPLSSSINDLQGK
jgi:hypothetical protein